MRFLRNALPVAVLSFGVASVLESWVTVEWWFPYCSAPTDGPGAAIFGLPLPYERFSAVSSLTYDFMPHVMALDVCLLGLAVAVPFATLAWRVSGPRSRLLRHFAWALGVALLSARVAWLAFAVSLGILRPVASLAASPYLIYGELRPLRVTTARPYYCEP